MDNKETSSVCDTDNDTFSTATLTPPPSTVNDDLEQFLELPNSSIPEPGSSYTIESTSCGRLLTLLDGQVVLKPRASTGCKIWICEKSQGWLGFRNTSSGLLLGYDAQGNICCAAKVHNDWERMHLRHVDPVYCGYNMLMLRNHRSWFENFISLWSVDVKNEGKVEKLMMVDGDTSDGLVWKFTKVVTPWHSL